MTQLLPDSALKDVGTHVLVIGVGRYPHLIEGGGTLANKTLGLGQLTSPPLSAARVIEWFLGKMPGNPKGYTNPASPLASLEALVSANSPLNVDNGQSVVTVGSATRVNIQNAFSNWLARLRKNDANIGVFYFCGHGVMVSDHYLLAEDFGESADLPWDQAFDLSNTLRAVERDVKGALYFFVDACREISSDVALTLGADPRALKIVDLKRPVLRSSSSLIYATGEGKLAFAEKDSVSRFTEALITALSGYCGVKNAGAPTWGVDGETIAVAIRRLLQDGNATAKAPQVSEQLIAGNSVPLTEISSRPRVRVKLDLTPVAMRATARFYLKSSSGLSFQHDGATGVFLTEVPRGFYTVGAVPAADEFKEVMRVDEELEPPVYSDILQATA